MSIKGLTNYLSVHGLNTSGRKGELVARAFAAFESKMNVIAPSEEQKLKLESDHQEMPSKHCDESDIKITISTQAYLYLNVFL